MFYLKNSYDVKYNENAGPLPALLFFLIFTIAIRPPL